jgi:phosphate transport system substrate-binding protein
MTKPSSTRFDPQRRNCLALGATAALMSLAPGARAQGAVLPTPLSGAGSTFAAALYASVSEQLGRAAQYRLAYEAVGSSEGVRRVLDRRVDFGASDRPMSRRDLNDAGLVQLPMAIGGVVVAVNLPNVAVAQMRLDAATLADLFAGRIERWNDRRLLALNPGIALPSLAVTPVFREDGSGTSYLFTSYLARTQASWREVQGVTSNLRLPKGLGATGNDGVVRALQSKPGTVAYLEYTYAKGNGFPSVQLRNVFGSWVSASPTSVEAAVRAADWERMFIDSQPTFEIDTIDSGCPGCWPIVGLTYVLAPRRFAEPARAEAFVRFVESLLDEGDPLAREDAYVPLPRRAKNLVRATLRSQIQLARSRGALDPARELLRPAVRDAGGRA